MKSANSPLSRRHLFGLGAGSAALALLAACGQAPAPTAVPPAAKPAEPAKPAEAPKPAEAAKPTAAAAAPAAATSAPAAQSAGAIPPASMNPAKAKDQSIKILIAGDFRGEQIKGYTAEFEKEFGAKVIFDFVG